MVRTDLYCDVMNRKGFASLFIFTVMFAKLDR